MARLARLRQAAYRLLSETFMARASQRPGELQAIASDVRGQCGGAADYSFFPALDSFLGTASQLNSDDSPSLAEEHTALFGVNTLLKPVPLHEAAFLHSTEESSGLMLASLEQHFASAGISLAPGGTGMPDHISTELDFLSILCGREAKAWDSADLKVVRRTQDRQRRFLEKHPVNWLPVLCDALLQRGQSLFYLAASAARSLAAHDVDYLEAMRPYLHIASAEAQPHASGMQ